MTAEHRPPPEPGHCWCDGPNVIAPGGSCDRCGWADPRPGLAPAPPVREHQADDADPWAGMNAAPGPRPRHLTAVPADAPGHAEEIVLDDIPEFPADKLRGPLADLAAWADDDGLPVSFVTMAGLAAVALASARGASLRLTAVRSVRLALYVALIGESGCGKGASQRPVMRMLRRMMPEHIGSNLTMEAIPRWFQENDGTGLVVNGELSALLAGLNQYKGGRGSDRYALMDAWDGEPFDIQRVADSKTGSNGLKIYVEDPRLLIFGGMVPENIGRQLGSDTDGLRARFVPVLASSEVRKNFTSSKPMPLSFENAIDELRTNQDPREWTIDPRMQRWFLKRIERWDRRRRNGADPDVVLTVLNKADEHCMRFALACAESAEPCKGGYLPSWTLQFGAAMTDYMLDCWAALGPGYSMAFSRRDEVLNDGVRTLFGRLSNREPHPESGRRSMIFSEIHHGRIAGANSPPLVRELVRAYLAAYPGCGIVFTPANLAAYPGARLADRADVPEAGTRGPAPEVIVFLPLRAQQKLFDRRVSAEHAAEETRTSDGINPAEKLFDGHPSKSFPSKSFPADPGPVCQGCGGPLDPSLAASGYTTHGGDCNSPAAPEE